ncbi:ATP-binding cassette domain-containing protein [Leucobacter sp. gxy201]|uniref:ABC transporter ATP-binding protein n=1 Tax=Leucobacter sp. gxy201 TaxID=2957200 RepID=UPI003DA04E58
MSSSETARPIVVSVEGVSKEFKIRQDNSFKERVVTFGRRGREHREEFWALNDVSIQIEAGHTVGLIGHNGSGKSTLLKMIGGILSPTSGTVSTRGQMAALLELGAGFHPDLTGRENVYLNASMLGLTEEQIASRFDDIVEFSEIGQFIDTQVKFYSSGMYVRLAFAVAVHTDPDVLLVDEVLAVGDEAFQKKCLDRIRQFQQEGRTIILVTHTLSTVEEMCDQAVLLDHGRVFYSGSPAVAVNEFRRILEEHRLHVAGRSEATKRTGRVVGAMAKPLHGKVGQQFVPGDSLELTVDLRSEEPLEDWDLVISVAPVGGGTEVFETSTARLQPSAVPVEGLRRLSFVLDDMHAGPGTYSIQLALRDADGVEIHTFPDAATITVEPDPLYSGVIYGKPRLLDHGRVDLEG